MVSQPNQLQLDTEQLQALVLHDHQVVVDLIELTYRSGDRELQLIQAQEFYANPRLQFSAERVR